MTGEIPRADRGKNGLGEPNWIENERLRFAQKQFCIAH